MSQDK